MPAFQRSADTAIVNLYSKIDHTSSHFHTEMRCKNAKTLHEGKPTFEQCAWMYIDRGQFKKDI